MLSNNKQKAFSFLKSIRTKLIIINAYIILATILLVSFFFYSYMNHRLIDISKEYLGNELQSVAQLIHNKSYSKNEIIDLFTKQEVFAKGPHQIKYALYSVSGELLGHSTSFLFNTISIQMIYQIMLEHETIDMVNHLLYKKKTLYGVHRITTGSDTYYLQFEINRQGHNQATEIFLEIIVLSFPFILLLALVTGYFLTKWVLAPVAKLTKTARNISMTNQSITLPVIGTGDELDELAITFNETFKKLHNSYEEIIRFTADASHELRLPITAIKGEAEIILEKERSPEEYQSVLGSMLEEMDRLSQIIKQLLTLTRSDSKKYGLNKENIDMVGFFNNIIEFYRALAESENIHLSFSSAETDAVFLGDRFKLQELFSNLIENAIKYTHAEGTIKLELMKEQNAYKVVVIDTGIGIPEEEQEKIFDRFYRVDKARSRKYGGSGLGLSISKMIINAHNGQIYVNSIPDQGSSFNVILPI